MRLQKWFAKCKRTNLVAKCICRINCEIQLRKNAVITCCWKFGNWKTNFKLWSRDWASETPEPLGRLVHRWQSHCLAHFIYAFAYRGSTTYKKVWPNRFTSATANWNLFVKIISAIAFYEQYMQSQFLKVSCNWNLNFIFEIAICKAYVRFQFAIVFHNPVLKIFIVIWFPITLSNSLFKRTFNYSQYVRQFKSIWIAQNEFRPE